MKPGRAQFVLLMVLVVLLVLPQVAVCAAPLPTDPKAIRNELRTLRKQASQNDPNVRARIDALMKQLQKLQAQRDAVESQARGEEKPDDDEDKAVMTRETIWEKVEETAAKGKGAKLDLAEPVRKEVARAYEEDRDKSIKNPAYYQAATSLFIDLSRKEASLLIDLLEKFSGITTLILTGGVNGAPVDLADILNKAKHLPLTELYIFNFRGYLSSVPESVGMFTELSTLSLFNNTIQQLPAAVGKLKKLRVLQVDINPITTLLPTINELVSLDELGMGKTKISLAEQAQLAKLLPNCRIVSE